MLLSQEEVLGVLMSPSVLSFHHISLTSLLSSLGLLLLHENIFTVRSTSLTPFVLYSF